MELVLMWLAAALDACADADGGGAHADAGVSRARAYAIERVGNSVEPMRMGKIRYHSLFFLFFFIFW
jgi:hypothetical protein